jgi:replicative DNA helicase
MPEATAQKVPPQSMEAEVSVLGAMLLDNSVIPDIIKIIDPKAFYSTAHRIIYQSIVELYDEKKSADLIILAEALRLKGSLEQAGGPDYLATLVDSVPSTANATHYANIVKNKGLMRRLIGATNKIMSEAYDPTEDPEVILDKAEQTIFTVCEEKISQDVVPISEVLKSTMYDIDNLQDRKGRLTGLPTGFYDIDDMTSGLQKSQFVIVAGRPSMGKSSFAMNIAEHVAVDENVPVAFFSLEVSKDQLAQNMLCSHARIDAHKMRRGYLAESEWPNLSLALGKLSEAPIYIDDTPGISVLELRAKARRLKARSDIGLLVVDYLQLMAGPPTESRQQEISAISRSLKALARELQIPLIALSQLSRATEAREAHRPRMSDLRESGAIEQEADVIFMLYREEYYDPEKNPGVAEIIIAKQRNGPTGTVNLAFLSNYMHFEPLAMGAEL